MKHLRQNIIEQLPTASALVAYKKTVTPHIEVTYKIKHFIRTIPRLICLFLNGFRLKFF